ncbi:hypothetical protein XpiCFBP4643_05785 [Xanthomonas pisi]|uniref:Uncharacterized protein n=1 Tax=Xanthomonas pisi TaxID=56457 RepID=A0A2S7D6A4_9XANT|nr:hypothetical protein XpiCFBP4643_05785 [Xanthomonas pisi]
MAVLPAFDARIRPSRDAGLAPAAILRNQAVAPSHAKFMLQCANFVTPPSQSGLSVLICC